LFRTSSCRNFIAF